MAPLKVCLYDDFISGYNGPERVPDVLILRHSLAVLCRISLLPPRVSKPTWSAVFVLLMFLNITQHNSLCVLLGKNGFGSYANLLKCWIYFVRLDQQFQQAYHRKVVPLRPWETEEMG